MCEYCENGKPIISSTSQFSDRIEYVTCVIKGNSLSSATMIHNDKIACTSGDFVWIKDYKALESKAEELKCELDKTYNQLMEVEKESQERIAELESELEVKDNLLKIKNGLCKPPMMTVLVAKTINGQDYVRLEDFMSVVDDLQNYDSYHAE